MNMLRVLFGSGWWILWYVAFYLLLLISVVMTLLIFGQELKSAGQKPDIPSPGSFLVLMIGVGLVLVTLIDACILAWFVNWPWYAKAAIVVGLPVLVGLITFPLNMRLATEQSRPVFWMNVVVAIAVAVSNLLMLRFALEPRE